MHRQQDDRNGRYERKMVVAQLAIGKFNIRYEQSYRMCPYISNSLIYPGKRHHAFKYIPCTQARAKVI